MVVWGHWLRFILRESIFDGLGRIQRQSWSAAVVRMAPCPLQPPDSLALSVQFRSLSCFGCWLTFGANGDARITAARTPLTCSLPQMDVGMRTRARRMDPPHSVVPAHWRQLSSVSPSRILPLCALVPCSILWIGHSAPKLLELCSSVCVMELEFHDVRIPPTAELFSHGSFGSLRSLRFQTVLADALAVVESHLAADSR